MFEIPHRINFEKLNFPPNMTRLVTSKSLFDVLAYIMVILEF